SCRLWTKALPRACHSGSSAAKMLTSTPMRRMRSRCCARAVSGHAAAPPSSVTNSRLVAWTMGSPSEPAVPAYRTLRLPGRYPQVLGADLNRSEVGREERSPSGPLRRTGLRRAPLLHLGFRLLAAGAVEDEDFWQSAQVRERLHELHRGTRGTGTEPVRRTT